MNISILISDSLFHQLYPQVILFLEQFFDINKEAHEAVDLTFAPEIWGGVLATVLGTLIIVIAIAAESTPKLMDLFVRDWISLIFIYYLNSLITKNYLDSISILLWTKPVSFDPVNIF